MVLNHNRDDSQKLGFQIDAARTLRKVRSYYRPYFIAQKNA